MGVAAEPTSRFAGDRLASVEQRMETVIGRWTPFIGLAVGLVATPMIVRDEVWVWYGVVPLVVGAAAWAWYFVGRSPARVELPGRGPVYVAGLLALMAPLVWYSPFFGFLAIAAYSSAFAFLPGRWRYVGLFVASAIVSYTYIGGRFAELTLGTVIGYGVLVLINMGVAGMFTWYGMFTSDLSMARRRTIEELDVTNARLSAALEENAGLHAQLMVQAREAGALDERQRLAAEIHDTLAQGFTGIITQLQAAEQGRDDRLRWQRHLDTAAALARENLAEARRSVRAMSPQALATAPLSEALQDLADRWSGIRDTRVQFTATGTARPMHPELEATLLRVTQEALSNVDKHAQAKRVGVTLSYMEDQITLDVRDDGVGFDMSAPASNGDGGFGLTGMRRRVQRLAGSLTVESEPGGGTAVSASMPALEMLPDGPQLADGVLAVPRHSEQKEPAE